jgi:ankyrin repeat protein
MKQLLHYLRRPSNWPVTLFFTFCLLAALISEFFQAPPLATNLQGSIQNPISREFLAGLNKITFENQLGSVSLQKDERNKDHWVLTSPRILPANKETIATLLASLSQIQIRKTYPADPINLANFALNTPTLSLKMNGGEDTSLNIKFGLHNPLDNSAYILIERLQTIYQITAPKVQLAFLGPSYFIDSKIFTMANQDIERIKIFNAHNLGGNTALSIMKKNGQWFNEKKQLLATDKVESFIAKIISVKSQMILDQTTKDVEKIVDNYIKSPMYSIEMVDSENRKIKYSISHLINTQIPELKIDRQKNIIIIASDRTHPYIVEKNYLSNFQLKEVELSNERFNSLFY